LGPMAGQAHHFLQFNPGKAPYAETRYATEVQRLYGVLDKQLDGQDFICGDYSIADMACWPWVARYEWQRVDLTQFPNVLRWYKALRARDAVIKGYQVPKDVGEVPRGEP
jgi:GST-like protein